MVAHCAFHFQYADDEAVGAMSTWDDLDAKFGGGGSGAGAPDSLDALDRRFAASIKGPPTKPTAEPVTDFKGTLQFGPFDTGLQLPEGVNKRLAQLGSGIADWTTRLGQLRGGVSEQDVEEKRRLDAALRNDFTGKALGVVGQALPALAIPAAAGAPVLSGIGAGALTGFMAPIGPGESATANTVLGAGLGGALPLAFKGAQSMLRPDAATAEAAAKAAANNIPIAAGDLSKNRFVQAARSFTNDLPVIGLPGQMLKEQQQAALNRAVGGTFGSAEARLTPDVIDAARSRMGSEFDRLWGRNNLTVDAPVFAKLTQLQAMVADLPKAQASKMQSEIDNFLSKMNPNAAGAPEVSGEAANYFQQWLRKQSAGQQGGPLQEAFSDLRKTVIDAFNRSIGPQDAAALTRNRTQYKAFKTVEPLLDKGVVGTAGRTAGDIPAALLPEAVRGSYSGLSSQTAAPQLADLAQVASRFMVDRTAQTGGSPRAMLQNMGLGGALLGGGAAIGGGGSAALGAAGAGGLNWLLNSPAMARALLNSSPQRGLLGAPNARELLKEAGLLSIGRAPLALPGLLTSPALE